MKNKFTILGIVAFLLLSLVPNAEARHKHKTPPPAPVVMLTPERAATHQIHYFKEPGNEVAECTGTAIGPHALLTATHCDEEQINHIQLDYSARYYTILAIGSDGRDHDIYVLDGPAFTNIVTVKAREAVLGESIVSYGVGGEDFPPHVYTGTVITDIHGGDQSDIDIREKTHAFSFAPISGDSGSAVYASDGSIVALLTWANGPDKKHITEAVGSALNFGQDVYQYFRDLKETKDNGDDTSPTATGNGGAASPNGPAQ